MGIPNPLFPPLPQPEQQRINKVVDELRRRGLHNDRCPRCVRSTNWATAFFQIPVGPETAVGFYTTPQLQAFIPVVSFTCTNCGYLVYHNLKVLGLDK